MRTAVYIVLQWIHGGDGGYLEPCAALVAGGYGDCPVVGSDTETTVSLDEGFQKASVAADETGTETAGATGVLGVVTTSYEEPELNPFTMKVDRPFLFALRDRETGSVLFLGQVVNAATQE